MEVGNFLSLKRNAAAGGDSNRPKSAIKLTLYIVSAVWDPTHQTHCTGCVLSWLWIGVPSWSLVLHQLLLRGWSLQLLAGEKSHWCWLPKGYGLGSGINLFIATSICKSIFLENILANNWSWNSKAPLSLSSTSRSSTWPDKGRALHEAFWRERTPNVMDLISTVLIFVIVTSRFSVLRLLAIMIKFEDWVVTWHQHVIVVSQKPA